MASDGVDRAGLSFSDRGGTIPGGFGQRSEPCHPKSKLPRPENVLSEEIAVERRFVDGKVRLSLFNENVHDALIAQLTQLADGTGRTASFVTNVEAVRNTGIELAAQKNNVLIDGLETFGSVTYVDLRICGIRASSARSVEPRRRASACPTSRRGA